MDESKATSGAVARKNGMDGRGKMFVDGGVVNVGSRKASSENRMAARGKTCAQQRNQGATAVLGGAGAGAGADFPRAGAPPGPGAACRPSAFSGLPVVFSGGFPATVGRDCSAPSTKLLASCVERSARKRSQVPASSRPAPRQQWPQRLGGRQAGNGCFAACPFVHVSFPVALSHASESMLQMQRSLCFSGSSLLSKLSLMEWVGCRGS